METQTEPGRTLVTEGEWAGWTRVDTDPFEMLSGPYYARWDDDGRCVCAFRAEAKHNNGGGFMHGGALMTFADFALFCIAQDALADSDGAVTVSMNTEFVGSARPGDLVEATGEVVRAGGSLVFVRGQITSGGRTLVSVSTVLKKNRRPIPAGTRAR